MKKSILFLFASSLVFLFSCSSPDKSKALTAEFKVKITAEGPLFTGANTLQGLLSNLPDSLKKILGENISPESVELSKLVLMTDTGNLDFISDMKIQAVSETQDMTDLGIINPIPKGSQSVELKLAGEQANLNELLFDKGATLVADANFNQNISGNVELTCKLEF